MFSADTLAFLADLRANNRRDWFEAHRARYETAVAGPARAFGAALASRLAVEAGGPVTPRLYRLHRDLRFARDKTPYNTHVHMGFTGPGPGAWLVGLEPGSLVLGYGIMAFDAPQLDTWRAAVAGQDGAALDRVLADLQALSLRLDPPELKRVPPPHAADHPRAALLKRKSLVVWNDGLPPDAAYGDRAPERLHVALQAFSPLHDWLASVSF